MLIKKIGAYFVFIFLVSFNNLLPMDNKDNIRRKAEPKELNEYESKLEAKQALDSAIPVTELKNIIAQYTASWKLITSIDSGYGSVMSLAFSRDNNFMISSASYTINVWDAKSFKLIHTISDPFKNSTDTGPTILSVAFSPNGKYIASGSESKIIKIWDAKTYNLYKKLCLEDSSAWQIDSLSYSSNNQYLSSTCGGTIRIFDANTYELIKKINDKSNIEKAIYSKNNKYLAGISSQAIMVWDADNYNLLHKISDIKDRSYLKSLAYSYDSRHLAVGFSRPDIIKIFDADSLNLVETLKGHKQSVRLLAYSPDNKYLVSASNTEFSRIAKIKIWDVHTYKLLQDLDLKDRKSEIRSLAFSADSKYLAIGLTNGQIEIWLNEAVDI